MGKFKKHNLLKPKNKKVHISGMAWQIQLKFGIGGVPPQRNSHRKLSAFLFREC